MEKLLFYLVIAAIGGLLSYLKNQKQQTEDRKRKSQQRPTAPVVDGQRMSYEQMLKKIRQEQAANQPSYQSVEQLPDEEAAYTDMWAEKPRKAQTQHMGRPSDLKGQSSGFGREERNPLLPPAGQATKARESHLKPAYKPIILSEEEQQLSALAKQRLESKAKANQKKDDKKVEQHQEKHQGRFSGNRLRDAVISQTVLERRHF